MIQDIFPHTFDNQYKLDQKPGKESPILYFQGDSLLLLQEPFRFPSFSGLPASSWTYLFSLDGTPFFLSLEEPSFLPENSRMIPVRELRSHPDLPDASLFLIWTAYQIMRWMRENRFCGSCGHPTLPSDTERALTCPFCGRTIYPRLNPAIIAAVTHGGKLRLTRYANRPFSYCALIAGFTEVGETLEETVKREVFEETGIHVKNIRYYKSQPWAIAGNILAGFFCEADGSTDITIDPSELSEAFWAEKKDIRLQPDDYSLTNEMMRLFQSGKTF